MRAYENQPDSGRRPRWLPCALLALSLIACDGSGEPYGFRVLALRADIADGHANVQGRLELLLSTAAREALESGIPLTISLDLRAVMHNRVINKTLLHREHRWRLQYQPLSEHYTLDDLTGGGRQTFPRLRHLLASMQRIELVLPLDMLAPGEYKLQLRAQLDLQELPAPMRLLAWLDPEWRLRSEWNTWLFSIPA